MKSKFKKLMAAALVLCLMLALLPAGVLADGEIEDAGEYDTIITYSGGQSGDGQSGGDHPGGGGQSGGGDQPGGKNGVTFTYFDITQYKDVTNTNDDLFAGGTVSVSDKQSDGSYTLTVTPDDGFGIKRAQLKYSDGTTVSIPIDNVSGLTYDIDPKGDTTIAVQVGFKELYTVNTSGITGGTVTATPATAFEGDTITLNVTASDGYDYVADSLKVTYGEGIEVPVSGNTFTMPASNVTVSAKFKYVPPVVVPTTYTVTTSSSVGGSVWADKSTGLNYGETVTVYVQPSDGYYLKSLTVGSADVTNLVTWDWYWNWYYGRTGTYSFTVTGNTSVYATFDTWYDGDIACIYDGRFGNVSLNVWSKALDRFVPYTSASKGDLVQVIVEPYNGYAMNSLSISERNYWGSSVDYWQSWKHDNVYYFYMPDSDVNLYVDFTEAVSEHIVYVDRAANGLLKADTTWAADGQIVYVTATPDTGYVLSSLFVKTAKGDQLKVYEAKKTGTYYFYMPDQYVTVSAYFAPAASALPFNDVAYTSWYYDAVKFVYDKGIMDGVSYYRFAPDATITRGMVVTMLWRMAGEPYEAAAGFTDVAAGRYYTTAVAWAARNGIVEGMTATTFAPDQAITREQLASILYRYAKWLGFSGYGSDISGYTDAGKVSSYAYDAMSWAVRSGVVTGTSARVLDPQGTASRAAAAQMFMNFYNYIK